MFSQELKDWICDEVKDKYLNGNCKRETIFRDIELFEKAVSLKAPDKTLEGISTDIPETLEAMSNCSIRDMKKYVRDLVSNVEPFLRYLLGIIYPERYKIKPSEEEGGDPTFPNWSLAPLLKQGFGIIKRDYSLSKGTPKLNTFPNEESYFLVYNKRNTSTHDCEKMNSETTTALMRACLIVFLDISRHIEYEIEEAFSKESIEDDFSAMSYCRKIIRAYKERVRSGFKYIDIKWRANNSKEAEISNVETLIKNISNPLVKLLGEAGSGKTTIMREMEYLVAQDYVAKKSTVIPVLISLGTLEIDAGLRADIKTMITQKLDVTTKVLEEMLSLNAVCLYLDGFNEILNTKLKKQIAWSIDSLTRTYPNLRIFLSDRALMRSTIDTMREAVAYRLFELDNQTKELFIKYNCFDESAKEMLLDYFSENPNYYEHFNTPIKLKQLIELTEHQKNVPQDFDEEYIRFLFERESVDKNDENVEYLEAFACAIALALDDLEKEETADDDLGEVKMPEYKAEACIANCKRILGYTIPDSRKCLRLLIEMGILVYQDGFISFKYKSYKEYFWITAFNNNIAEVLMEE